MHLVEMPYKGYTIIACRLALHALAFPGPQAQLQAAQLQAAKLLCRVGTDNMHHQDGTMQGAAIKGRHTCSMLQLIVTRNRPITCHATCTRHVIT
jgi:hypothetical protein